MKITNNKKGFTLGELLIVVGIVSVLTTISIPVFSGKKDKACLAVDLANARSAKAAAVSEYLFDSKDSNGVYFYDSVNGTVRSKSDGIDGYGQMSYNAFTKIKDKSIYEGVFEDNPVNEDGSKNILKMVVNDESVNVSWVKVGSGTGATGTTNSTKPIPAPIPSIDPGSVEIPSNKIPLDLEIDDMNIKVYVSKGGDRKPVLETRGRPKRGRISFEGNLNFKTIRDLGFEVDSDPKFEVGTVKIDGKIVENTKVTVSVENINYVYIAYKK